MKREKAVRTEKTSKTESPERPKIIPVKAYQATRKRLQRNADRWTRGNLSRWLTTAGLKYRPDGDDENFF